MSPRKKAGRGELDLPLGSGSRSQRQTPDRNPEHREFANAGFCLRAAPAPRAARVVGRWRLKKIMVRDNSARGAIKLAIPDLGLIPELGRENLQERVAIRGGQRFREPEKLVELVVGKVNRHGAFLAWRARPRDK